MKYKAGDVIFDKESYYIVFYVDELDNRYTLKGRYTFVSKIDFVDNNSELIEIFRI